VCDYQFRISGITAWLLLAVICGAAQAAEPDWRALRSGMLREIAADFRDSGRLTGVGVADPRVMAALNEVPRHEFVPEHLGVEAYRNQPLPIGQGQTISQPFIVALMTELLDVDADARVLELGTGSGYQAAVLASLVRNVYTIEIVEPLARQAAARLAALGFSNVEVRHGDGVLGWPDAAPFDGIIVTAAGIEIPQALKDQLRVGARLVMPVGAQSEIQNLMVLTKNADGSISERATIPVRFVPITGDNL
jgi:protein-L-isoaspartate(D-aspartate) O-methyltransferase